VLHKTARVEGDLETPSVMIEEGAVFNGSLKMNAGGPAGQKLKPVDGGANAPKKDEASQQGK
jgi:cytoskeletal protein CcmA (bactofilin family)